ncbi:hypothetical protein PLESTB_001709000 [Pleodorina starrii]|uniref:Ribosomal protein L6 n=1 Tax=Pleodorina starrii TaxID=330485 RepID=A0A9W6F9S6_9CHLO|nr:hypothetical protein PLESTM_002038800 [Pleodorina starrii]GLC61035.1 hypothetical protein PLESTB_001709000 [Pleodorina starrii]GLC76602.1 hypothetical protein PLESTF_001803800 [Pleodorina starrii]
MIASLSRSVSGLPGAVHPGALQSLIQQSVGACQELDLLQAWSGSPRSTISGDSDGAASAPSTSYGSLLPEHFRRHHYHEHRSAPAAAAAPLPPLSAHLQLQQLRSYRIPNRVAPPKIAYSERSGRAAPQPWPEFEAVKAPQGEVRWHRSVVRFPPEVSVQLEAASPGGGGDAAPPRTLLLSGKAGSIRLNLQDLDPTGLLAFRLINLPSSAAAASGASASGGKAAQQQQQQQQSAQQPAPPQRSLLVLASPNKARFDAVGSELNKAIRGVMTGYLVGLTVKGVGYRMEPVEDPTGEVAARVPKLTYAQLMRRARAPGGAAPKPYYFEAAGEEKQAVSFPYNKPASAIRLKVGYSRTVVYPLPPHIRAFCLKPTLLYLYGLELDELQRVAAEIRGIRKPNPYTGNGVQYVDEVVKLKQRARAK